MVARSISGMETRNHLYNKLHDWICFRLTNNGAEGELQTVQFANACILKVVTTNTTSSKLCAVRPTAPHRYCGIDRATVDAGVDPVLQPLSSIFSHAHPGCLGSFSDFRVPGNYFWLFSIILPTVVKTHKFNLPLRPFLHIGLIYFLKFSYDNTCCNIVRDYPKKNVVTLKKI